MSRMIAVGLYWKNQLQLVLSAYLNFSVLSQFEPVPKENTASENCMVARVFQVLRNVVCSLKNILYWASLSALISQTHEKITQLVLCLSLQQQRLSFKRLGFIEVLVHAGNSHCISGKSELQNNCRRNHEVFEVSISKQQRRNNEQQPRFLVL